MDVIKIENWEPRADYVNERLNKELKKIKVVDNREEVFSVRCKEYIGYYVRNRSRQNNWRNYLDNKGL